MSEYDFKKWAEEVRAKIATYDRESESIASRFCAGCRSSAVALAHEAVAGGHRLGLKQWCKEADARAAERAALDKTVGYWQRGYDECQKSLAEARRIASQIVTAYNALDGLPDVPLSDCIKDLAFWLESGGHAKPTVPETPQGALAAEEPYDPAPCKHLNATRGFSAAAGWRCSDCGFVGELGVVEQSANPAHPRPAPRER